VPEKTKIFISYRRAGRRWRCRALADWLRDRNFEVFLDVSGIEAGDEFPEVLDRKLEACDVLLAVIGPT
jgi:hypothetical protein